MIRYDWQNTGIALSKHSPNGSLFSAKSLEEESKILAESKLQLLECMTFIQSEILLLEQNKSRFSQTLWKRKKVEICVQFAVIFAPFLQVESASAVVQKRTL